MAILSHLQNRTELVGEHELGATGELAGRALEPLAHLLRNATVGVALCDRSLHCKALNGALAAMDFVSASLLGGELSALLSRSLKLARRSLELLNCSNSLRCYVYETRMETALLPLALFLSVTRTQQQLVSSFESPHADAPVLSDGVHVSPGTELSPVCPSPREREVLQGLAYGKSNKEIASDLAISTRTVETYRARIMLKLKLHSTADLVRYAVRNKIIDA